MLELTQRSYPDPQNQRCSLNKQTNVTERNTEAAEEEQVQATDEYTTQRSSTWFSETQVRQGNGDKRRTFLAHGNVLVRRLVVPLAVAQVAGVHRHRGFDLQLGQLHALVEDPEELLRLLVRRQPPEEGVLGASEGFKEEEGSVCLCVH